MTKTSFLIGKGVFFFCVAAIPLAAEAATYIDLGPVANRALEEPFPGRFPNNSLVALKPGLQDLGGLTFKIGTRFIQLAGDALIGKLPEKVEGIPVNTAFAAMQVMHATCYTVPDDTVIAKYIVHYEDDSTETVEVVYGRDVRDWWGNGGDEAPTNGKVVWEGSNDAAQSVGKSLWLFAQHWDNPHPAKKVVSVDFVSTMTRAAPFLVAMTVGEDLAKWPTTPAPSRSYLIWIICTLIVVVAGISVFVLFRRRRRSQPEALSVERRG